MQKSIQVLKPIFNVEETLEEIRECLMKGWTGIGFKTTEFETKWCEYTGFKYACFLNSATAGLHLAVNIFKAKFGWAEGDEIITSSLTFVSTNHAILYERLTPCFCDIDSSLCLDPDSVRAAISDKTRAIIYVGIGGNSSNYRAIKEIADEHNLVLILDAAHMAGTKWTACGTQVGVDADCAVFSFQAVKNLPSSDSGMICFKDGELDKRTRVLSWLGIDKTTYDRYSESSYKWRYDVQDLGFKYHGNSISAAICLVSLRYLEEHNARRRAICELYESHLAPLDNVILVKQNPEALSSRHLCQIIVEERDQLIDFLAGRQIYCGVHYIPNHRYGLYTKFAKQLPNTDHIGDRLVSLPLHLNLSDDDVFSVINAIHSFKASARADS